MLHVLTPKSSRSPADLIANDLLGAGDCVADLRLFPPRAYTLGLDRTLQDVGARLVPDPDYWTDARAWLVRFTQQSGLQDLLSVGGYGIWWSSVCRQFIPALSDYGNLFAWIDLFKAIREQANPDSVVVYGRHHPILHLVDRVYHGVEIQVRPDAAPHLGRALQPTRRLGLLIVRLFLSAPSLLYILIRRPQIGFFSTTSLLRKQGVGAEERLHDIFLGPVAEALKGRGWSTLFLERYGWNASWAGLAARGLFFPHEVLSIFTRPRWFKLGLFRRTVDKWWRRWLDIEGCLPPLLQYRGVDVSPLILPLIRQKFSQVAPTVEILAGFWHRIFGLWRPKLLYFHCYYGRSNMAANIAAKKLGIPTIEQQHGAVSKNNMAYLVPAELDLHSEYPLCDRMTVWGERMVRLLVAGGVYQPDQAVVCGSPRIDWLLGQLPPRTETLAQLGIAPDRSVVLYTSNMLAEGLVYDILDSIRQGPGPERVHWIVKLHPREKTRAIWESAIRERSLSCVTVIEGELDFYALLAACDIHISMASTTLLESAILGKLNLGLDVPNMPDPAGYAEVNAFLPVAPDKLGSAVSDILADAERRQGLLAVQKAFATDWCVHDGQAIRRIVALVEATLQNSASREGDDAAL